MTPSKNWIWGTEHRLSMQAQAEHKQAQAEHEQARANLKISDFGHSNPDITNFIKNLWRTVTPSKSWILRSSEFKILNFLILSISNQISPILWRILGPPKNWILGTEHKLSMKAEHKQAQAEHKQARANFGIFGFWAVRARYHWFCEEFMEGNDTFQK